MKVGDRVYCKKSYGKTFIKGRYYTIKKEHPDGWFSFENIGLQFNPSKYYKEKKAGGGLDWNYFHKYFECLKDSRKKKLNKIMKYETNKG